MSNKHSSIGFLAGVAILIAAPILHGASPVPISGDILYVSDMTASTIYTFTPAGAQSPFVSCGLTCAPEGLAFDATGNLYVADFNNGTIREYSSTGTLINATFITGLSEPVGLAFDAAGNLYVANLGTGVPGTGSIQKFGPTGGAIPLITVPGLTPYALAFDAAGILYEADSTIGPTGTINRFTTAGTALTPFITGLDYPQGLAFGAAGNLYVSEAGPQDVEEFGPTGTFIKIFASGFGDPFGLAFDADGNLYVGDYSNGTITKVDPTDTVMTTFASGLMNPTLFAFGPAIPFGVYQVHYASNLNIGESWINMVNDGSLGAGGFGPAGYPNALCANVYTFLPDEQLINCCSCLITPDSVVNLGVNRDLISNTLTGVQPSSVTVKIITSTPPAVVGGVPSCNPALVAPFAAGVPGSITQGIKAWGTTVHNAPSIATPPGLGNSITETAFTFANLNLGELAQDVSVCAFIALEGSGTGECKSCGIGALGADKQ